MKKVILFAVLMVISVAIFGQDPDPVPGSGLNVWIVISGILLVGNMFFSLQIGKLRSKGFAVLLLGKEAIELVDVVLKASQDGTFNKTEQANIKKEAQDVRSAWRALLGRSG